METIEKSAEVLNDLIQINNDRIVGFERAAKELKPEDDGLRNLFTLFSQDSRYMVQQLSATVAELGEQPETGHTISGTLHRGWLDVKATFSGHDRKSILEECERGEDAIKKAYKDALQSEHLPESITTLLHQQLNKVQEGHGRIKALRDEA
jgi:uncharacterized protein (TIGR02284 family)